MRVKVYSDHSQARRASNDFYSYESGFSYTDEIVDLWSKDFKLRLPKATLHGIDIPSGRIQKAKSLLADDAQSALPWAEGFFDLNFARGPFFLNQHSMGRPSSIAVIESWHEILNKTGKMISSLYADLQKFGTNTNPLEVALPYNRAPRLIDTVEFTGGKYHSDIQSFLAPFWKAKIVDYRIIRNNHILLTSLDRT